MTTRKGHLLPSLRERVLLPVCKPVCTFPVKSLFPHMTDTAVPCHLLTTQAHSSMVQGDQFKIAITAYLNSLEANVSCLNKQVNSWDYNCLQRAVCCSSSWIPEMLQQLWRKVTLVLHATHDRLEI